MFDISKKIFSAFIATFLLLFCFGEYQTVVNAENIDPLNKNVVLNLSANGEYINNFSGVLKGGQAEKIKFGKNFDKNVNGNMKKEGEILWNVLSSSDNKYGDNGILLWADYSVGKAEYNLYLDNPNYAFWNNSNLKAILNGGNCLDKFNGGDIISEISHDGWINTLFSADERNAISDVKEYSTVNFGYSSALEKSPFFFTKDLVGDGAGQYSKDLLSKAKVAESGTNVIEKTKGNKLFVLDYYDVNNADYGFASNGKTFATILNSEWKPEVDSGYYSRFEDTWAKIETLSYDYLADNSSGYWLRPAGRRNSTESVALVVENEGYVTYAGVNMEKGVRPALVLNPENVLYASNSQIKVDDTFKAVPDNGTSNPYEIYIKSLKYKNYNKEEEKPVLSATKTTISVATKESGKAMFILRDKTSGSVKYQAVGNIVDGNATVNVPETIAKDYNVAVLFVDDANNNKLVNGSYVSSYPEYVTNEYVVKFVDEDGNNLSTLTVKKGNTIDGKSFPKAPVKENNAQYTYAFDGWYNGDVKWNADDVVTADITLKAKYTETVNKYTVTFDGKNSVEVEYNGTVSQPEQPEKTDNDEYAYKFDGWYNGDVKWDFNNKVTENVDLVSKFIATKKKYTVTFDGKNPVEVEYGSFVSPANSPVKEQTEKYTYKFDGWYNGDVKWNFASDKITKDINFTSKFAETLREYKLFVAFKGMNKAMYIGTYAYGSKVDFSQFAEDGYNFVVKLNGVAVDELVIDKNINIDVEYTPSKKGCKSSIDLDIIAPSSLAVICAVIMFALNKKRN